MFSSMMSITGPAMPNFISDNSIQGTTGSDTGLNGGTNVGKDQSAGNFYRDRGPADMSGFGINF
jgi:hypothetical protein